MPVQGAGKSKHLFSPLVARRGPLRTQRSAIQVGQFVTNAGVDPFRLARTARGTGRFLRDWARYRRLCRDRGIGVPRTADLLPIIGEKGDSAGIARGHYFHQDLWAARKIYRAAPDHHVDIGSRVDGFVAHLLTFRSVTVVDIRHLESVVEGLTFVRDDVTRLASFLDGSVPSLSSLHAIEHVGLGRYGDELDPDGWRKAVGAISRVVMPGGSIYFSVPCGRERTLFNSHRILDPRTVVDAFAAAELVDFGFVDDDGNLITDASLDAASKASYGCGLFEFVRQ
ncbi:MAG: DUF268 domain-containing protein [Acidimicrobiales bacterium]